jgi:hypothetical protein
MNNWWRASRLCWQNGFLSEQLIADQPGLPTASFYRLRFGRVLASIRIALGAREKPRDRLTWPKETLSTCRRCFTLWYAIDAESSRFPYRNWLRAWLTRFAPAELSY